MSISIVSRISDRTETGYGSIYEDDEECPDYDAVVKRSNSNATTSSSVPYSPRSSFDDPSPVATRPPGTHTSQRRPRPLPRHERYIYSYCLRTQPVNGTPIQFLISVEPESGKPVAGKCTFRLSAKVNGIERAISEPTSRMLRIDPRQLEFVVFIFPGKKDLPSNCLWCLRVWLRVGDTDHRLFGEDELWIGKDPDFNAIGDASFARLKPAPDGGTVVPGGLNEQVYHAYVGRALVTFTVRWKHISHKLYRYSLFYEAGGVGDVLFDDIDLKLDNDPRTLSFLIFSLPSNSLPAGASHKLRIWVRSLVPLTNLAPSHPSIPERLPFNDSYIYQRLWKHEGFKIGGRLEFDTLGSKMVKAFAAGAPDTVVSQGPVNGSGNGALQTSRSMRKDRKELEQL